MANPQKLLCVVENIVDHGDHVYTLELTSESPFPRFKSGQFLHLTMDEYDPSGFWPDSRVFSIASSPGDRESIKIVYSVKGKYTTRMEKELSIGKEVWIKLPYGEFFIDPDHPAVLIAGGTGISAFTSFIEGSPAFFNQPIYLFYGARNIELLIFKDFVNKQKLTNQNLQNYYFVEDLPKNMAENYLRGVLSTQVILSKINTLSSPKFYLSGPPAMVKKVTSDLKENGIAEDLICTDAWE